MEDLFKDRGELRTFVSIGRDASGQGEIKGVTERKDIEGARSWNRKYGTKGTGRELNLGKEDDLSFL